MSNPSPINIVNSPVITVEPGRAALKGEVMWKVVIGSDTMNANANDSQLYVALRQMTSPNLHLMSQNSGELAVIGSVRRLRPLMGTFCAIEASAEVSACRDSLDVGVNLAYAAIQQVINLMHPVHGLDLSRINRTVDQVIQVNELTWQVLQLAKHISECSNGVFDPCLPSHAGRMRDVELLPDNQVMCHAAVMLDLGGIAKGFAVDCAIDVLKGAGCIGGVVNAGGDVRVFGKPQSMFIQHSTRLTTSKSVHPEPVEGFMQTAAGVSQLELCDQALAVSDFNLADRPVEHQGYYQRNSQTLPIHQRIAVVAKSAAVADALTKCGMWQDIEVSEQLCKTFDAKIVIAEKL